MKNLENTLSNLGLTTRISIKNNEENDTKELMVRDIEVLVDNSWIEVVGFHLHGRIFIEGLEIPVGESFYTGCCGIGTSRITNIIFGLQK
jgi:hypothetical protein